MCLNWNFIKDVDTPVRLGRCVRGPPSWLWKRSRSWHYRASCPCCSLTVVSGEGGQPILFRYFSPLNFFYQSLRTYIRQKFVWAQSFKTDKRSKLMTSEEDVCRCLLCSDRAACGKTFEAYNCLLLWVSEGKSKRCQKAIKPTLSKSQ